MAETVALVLLIACACEGLIIWLLLSELAEKDLGVKWDKFADSPKAPRQMTARDIAAKNLERQVERQSQKQKPVTRKPHDWASLRNTLENGFKDPENERAKRVEKFLGEDHAS